MTVVGSPEYKAAVAHPYHVSVYRDWSDHEGTTVGFQTEVDARFFATIRPEPLIDLVRKGDGVIAARRMLAYPGADVPPRLFDDFPDLRA